MNTLQNTHAHNLIKLTSLFALVFLLATLLAQSGAAAQNTLTLTASPYALALYNTPIPNATFTYTLTGFVNGDTESKACTGSVELSTPAKQGSPVGIYTVNVGGNLSCANYKIVINTGELHIKPAMLSIVPVSIANVPAGSQLQTYSYNCYFDSKLVGTNSCGSNFPISGGPTYVTTATTHATTKPGIVVYTSPTGTYDLHATWGSLKSVGGNYSFAFPTGSTLTIVPAAAQ
jgi:hypothetical protein